VPASRVRREVHHRFGRVLERWVPEPVREARFDPGRRGSVVLLAVAAIAAVLAAVGVWRSAPQPRPVTPAASAGLVSAAGASSDPAGPDRGGTEATGTVPAGTDPARPAASVDPAPTEAAGPAAAEPAVTEIVVSVTGLVAGPGTVTLPPGARVADAIAAAGGPTADADLTGLNLATRLADGDSVVVGGRAVNPAPSASSHLDGATPGGTAGAAPGSPDDRGAGGGAGGSSGSAAAPVDLNGADAAALEQLPGVGPVLAGAIVRWRTEHGRFDSVDQLQEVPGIGPTRFATLAELVTA
jgi:competence protein ComEA